MPCSSLWAGAGAAAALKENCSGPDREETSLAISAIYQSPFSFWFVNLTDSTLFGFKYLISISLIFFIPRSLLLVDLWMSEVIDVVLDGRIRNLVTGIDGSGESDENRSGPSREKLGFGSSRHTRKEQKSPTMKKKILAEKNGDATSLASSGHASFGSKEQAKPELVSAADTNSLVQRVGAESCSGFYDPLTNYTCPRPRFLRYNPNSRLEILMRIERARMEEEELVDASNCDFEESDMEDEEEARRPLWWSKRTWTLFLIGWLVYFSCYFSSIDSGFHSPKDDGSSMEDFTKLHDNHSPSHGIELMLNFMGVSEICFNVAHKELTCSIDGGSIEDSLKLQGNIRPSQVGTEFMITLMGLSETCFNVPLKHPTCPIESNGESMVVSDVQLEQKSSFEDAASFLLIPWEAERTNELLIEKVRNKADDLVIKEEVLSSLEQEKHDQGNDISVLAILDTESVMMEENTIRDALKKIPKWNDVSSETALLVLVSLCLLTLLLGTSSWISLKISIPRSLLLPVFSSSKGFAGRDEPASSIGMKEHSNEKFSDPNANCNPPSCLPKISRDLEVEDKLISSAGKTEYTKDKVGDGVSSKPLNSPSKNGRVLASNHPPVVQLLSKFVTVERTRQTIGSGHENIASEAESTIGLQLVQCSMKSTSMTTSSSNFNVVASVLSISPTSQKQTREKQARGMDSAPTPLRRSSRLSSRAISASRQRDTKLLML
ncbi:hypothetical protein ZIOFF_025264 [Zingiber officinale]|uniref:Uncharacterized protein n=1 Tax=Zingiber officinale TaxID=94328 RepID=A0A8J5H3G6_ZINOF|nr:hypothetical protein ZIOFF_025264 [Zingiber officinale]